MHTPRCVPLYGDMETIVLPRTATTPIAAGALVNSGLVIPEDGALVVTAPVAGLVRIPCFNVTYDVFVKAGLSRIIPPSRQETQAVLFTFAAALSAWIEDLRGYDQIGDCE